MSDVRRTIAEEAVAGIRVRNGRLRILPTGPAVVLGTVSAVFGIGCLAVAVVAWPLAIALWFGAIGAFSLLSGWRTATARAVADDRGLRIRNHWRTFRLRWDEIAAIDAIARRREWGRLPYSSPWRGPKDFIEGRVILTSGAAISVDALVSEAPTAGFSLPGGQVASEVKTAVLSRWMQPQRTAGT